MVTEHELVEVLIEHQVNGFYPSAPAGPGWYCTCGEPYAGDEPYALDAHPRHVAKRIFAALGSRPMPVCTDPDCTIPRRPGSPMHGPHDFRASDTKEKP